MNNNGAMPRKRGIARACLLELYKEWGTRHSTIFDLLKHAAKEDYFCVFATFLHPCLKWFLFRCFGYWCVFLKFEGVCSWTTGGNEKWLKNMNLWKLVTVCKLLNVRFSRPHVHFRTPEFCGWSWRFVFGRAGSLPSCACVRIDLGEELLRVFWQTN